MVAILHLLAAPALVHSQVLAPYSEDILLQFWLIYHCLEGDKRVRTFSYNFMMRLALSL